MKIYFDLPIGWWIMVFLVYLIYFLLLIIRKGYKNKRELKFQFALAFLALIPAFVFEFIAVSLNLWNYNPGNWPIALWIGYFGMVLVLYQFIKFLERVNIKK